jgi:DNA-binding response OmpR family regulator
VVIADDEPRIRFALRACLEAEGYRVEEAADGDDALGLVIQFAPDLMILDLAMPKLDGIRTLRALEGVHGQLKPKVIVLTAWSSPPAILRTIGLGASVFLEKPVLPDDLRRVVAKVLNEPPGPLGGGPAASYESQEGVPINWDAGTAWPP